VSTNPVDNTHPLVPRAAGRRASWHGPALLSKDHGNPRGGVRISVAVRRHRVSQELPPTYLYHTRIFPFSLIRRPERFPNLLCMSFSPAVFNYPGPGGALDYFSPPASPSQFRNGSASKIPANPVQWSLTRLQSSLHVTARRFACPAPVRTFTLELSLLCRIGASSTLHGLQSTTVLDFHQLDTQHYGLRAKQSQSGRRNGGLCVVDGRALV